MDVIAGGKVTAEKEAKLIMNKIAKLKSCKTAALEVGVPACKYLLDRRITELSLKSYDWSN